MEILLLAVLTAAVSAEAVLLLAAALLLHQRQVKPAAEASAPAAPLPPLSEQLLKEWLYGMEEDKK